MRSARPAINKNLRYCNIQNNRWSLSTALIVGLALCWEPPKAYSHSIDGVLLKASRLEVQSQKYLAAAEKIGDVSILIKRFEFVDYKEHVCNALGEVLRIGTNVAENSVQPDPGLDSSDASLLVLYAQSLHNYNLAAKTVIDFSEFSRRYRWNLYCADRYESSIVFPTDELGDAELSVTEDGFVLELVGDIIPNLSDEIRAELDANKKINTVRLASRGGSIEEAIKIGRLIRERTLNTVMSGDCDSSCSLVMIGGVRRTIPPPFYSVGFHRISISGETVADNYGDYEIIRQYADVMNVAGNMIVEAWKSGDGSYFYRPSQSKLCEMRIVTENC